MKLNTQDLWRRLQFPVLVLTAMAPIAPSLSCYLMPQVWWLSWVFAAVCLALGCFGMLLEKKIRKLYGYGGILVLMAMGVLLLPSPAEGGYGYHVFAVPVLYSFALLVILPMADLERTKEPHAAVFAVGVGLYLFWQVFYRIRITSNDPAMEPAEPGILISFLVFLCLTLVSRNRSTLVDAALGRFALPPVMRRVNKLLIVVFLGGVLLLGAVPFIGKVLAAPIVWAFQGIGVLLGLFLSKKPTSAPAATEIPEEIVTQAGENIFELNSNRPEGIRLPDIVTVILGALFVLVLAYFLVRALIMLVRFVIRLLSAMVRGSETSGSEDYEDEVSDVRDTVTALTPEQKAHRLTASQRKELSPEQQIRYRYRVLKKKHPKWRSSDTVRQQLPEDAASLYERTRYGGKAATAEEAKAFETKTRRL